MADIIDELTGLDDAALSKRLGFDTKLETVKTALAEAAATEGKVRKQVATRLTEAFTPSTYVFEDIGYTIKRAKQEASGKTTPANLVAGCGCDVAD